MKILIVDDSRAMQQIIRRTLDKLERTDLIFEMASDASEGLEIAEKWRPHLILLDWHMPEMSGLELFIKLTKLMVDFDIGFITTETSEKRLSKALDMGCAFIVNKPFEAETLLEEVRPLLEKKAKRDKEQKVEETKSTVVDKDDGQKVLLPTKEALEKSLNLISVSQIKVAEITDVSFSDSWLPCVVGLFTHGQSDQISAMAIMDAGAVKLLGEKVDAVAGGSSFSSSVFPQNVMDGCERVLRLINVLMEQPGSEIELNLKNVTSVKANIGKLEGVINQRVKRRADYELRGELAGVGRMVLMTQ